MQILLYPDCSIGRDHPDIGVIIALSQFECQEQFSENHPERRALAGMTWNILEGSFQTKHIAHVKFRLPEFSSQRTIHWKVHVDEHTDPDKARYDMIIGTYLLKELKMEFSFKDQTMV